MGLENSVPGPKKFRSKYTALISLLELDLSEADYRKEIGLIKRIISLGYTELQLYGAWNYYDAQNKAGGRKKFHSYAIFLWQKCKLIKDILTLLQPTTQSKLDNKDYRTSKDYVEPPKSKRDFLR